VSKSVVTAAVRSVTEEALVIGDCLMDLTGEGKESRDGVKPPDLLSGASTSAHTDSVVLDLDIGGSTGGGVGVVRHGFVGLGLCLLIPDKRCNNPITSHESCGGVGEHKK
jgi:hypothetical protein